MGGGSPAPLRVEACRPACGPGMPRPMPPPRRPPVSPSLDGRGAGGLGGAAATARVLAVLDDLHAADEASLALLQLLAGDLHRTAALFLFTVRDTEPSVPLGQALGELLRHPRAERVAVSGFESADVAALLERLTAEPPHADVVSALMSRTGGDPLVPRRPGP